MSEHEPRLDAAGIGLIGVGTGATWQAAALRERGITFPLLSDPDRRVYERLALPRGSWAQLLRPASAWRYARWALRNLRGGHGQGRFTGDVAQLPGTAVLDAEGALVWLHRGEGLGDYPSLEETLEAVEGASAG